jgi:hypothetical protein
MWNRMKKNEGRYKSEGKVEVCEKGDHVSSSFAFTKTTLSELVIPPFARPSYIDYFTVI